MIRDVLASGRAFLARTPWLALPAAAVLLASCATSGYSYREDRGGGYYYGTPSVEYREVTPYPYGAYGWYGPYRHPYPGPYGYRYYRYYGPYAYPYYYGYPYTGSYRDPYRHRHPVPRPPQPDLPPDRPRSPWRDLDDLTRRRQAPPPASGGGSRTPTVAPPAGRGGFGDRLRRAKDRAAGREGTP